MPSQQLADTATHAMFIETKKIFLNDYRYGKLTPFKEYPIQKRENGEFCIIDDQGNAFWHVFCISPETDSWGMFKPKITI